MARDERFSETETGLSHPLKRLSVRLSDDGQILIQAGDHAGIVIDEDTGVVTIFGAEIRLMAENVTSNGKKIAAVTSDKFSEKHKTGEMMRMLDGKQT